MHSGNVHCTLCLCRFLTSLSTPIGLQNLLEGKKLSSTLLGKPGLRTLRDHRSFINDQRLIEPHREASLDLVVNIIFLWNGRCCHRL